MLPTHAPLQTKRQTPGARDPNYYYNYITIKQNEESELATQAAKTGRQYSFFVNLLG